MFKKYQMNEEEEEKVGNSDTKLISKTKKYSLYDKNKSFNEKEIDSNLFKNNQMLTEINSSTKCLRNNFEKFKIRILDNSRNYFVQKNDDNKIVLNNEENKILKYGDEVLLDKEELFNAFNYFQQLLKKEEYKCNRRDEIKNKLFDFILKRKSNKNKVKINNNNLKREENIFNTYDCHQLYPKILYDVNTYRNSIKKIIKSFSFSFSNNYKQNIFDNFCNLSKENIRDTPKSVSQLFDEILLTENKIKDKSISEDNSKFSNHEYSFDLKHKEKNEISFQSIPDKEKQSDKFFDFDNTTFLINNYNSYKKEFKHNNSIINKRKKILKNDFNKTNNLELNSVREKEEIEVYNKSLYDEKLFKEKLTISPSRNIQEKTYIQNERDNIKNKESFIETEKTAINEIKVNKSRILYNKENLINEKLKELDEEIKQFREEKKKMELIKDEYEKLKIKLLKDIKELDSKKQIQEKYFCGDYDRMRIVPKSESRLIMAITQHNKSLILNNDKKTETIKLLKNRIHQLENIIKNRNKNIKDSKKIHEGIIKSIKENNINIFTKKKNDTKKKSKDDYKSKGKNINLKKKKASCSLEKINENYKNDNLRKNINKNMNFNNLNKLYFDNKNNKKNVNNSYSEQINIKNNTMTSKILNFNNLITTGKRNHDPNSHGYNLTTIENINKKNNNTIKGNQKNYKRNVKIEHPNLLIYEKLIKNEKEKERINKYNRIKLNINSGRDFGEHKKIMKKLKTELYNNDEKIKEKYKRIINNNNQISEFRNASKNLQKSQGKNPLLRRLELKIDKNKNNFNLFILNKVNNKNNKIKNILLQEKNTINIEKTNENNNCNRKENKSLDNKNINKNIEYDPNNVEFKKDENIEGYDFIIPDKYKLMNNGKIINILNSDGKIINIFENNKKEIIFQSGVRKEIFPDGYQLINFPNGDMKQKFVGDEEKVMYFYSETNTVQTSFKNGVNIFKFNNGQIEKHYPDGSKYIFYYNGMRRKISKNGTEEDFIPEENNKFNEEINKNQIVDII